MTSLIDQYNVVKNSPVCIHQATLGSDLTILQRNANILHHELPHIFEVCWFINNLVNIPIKVGNSFWSSTPTKCWVPTCHSWASALYTGTITRVNKSWYRHIPISMVPPKLSVAQFQVDKSTINVVGGGITILMPCNTTIDRTIRPTEEQIQDVFNSSIFPREFFDLEADWKDFSSYTKQIKIEDMLVN